MRQICSILLICCILIPFSKLKAGGSPETTLVVVNGDSPLSLTVANHYVQLRQIPQNNVVWLYNIPSLEEISIQEFRTRIWSPIKQFMDKQGISDNIDLIAYSADFPFAVKLEADLRKHNVSKNKYLGGYASLTSLTYFSRQVEHSKIGYLNLLSNRYFRLDLNKDYSFQQKLTPEDQKLLSTATKNLKNRKYQQAYDSYLFLNNKYPKLEFLLFGLIESQAGIKEYNSALDNIERLANLGFKNTLRLRNSKHLKAIQKNRKFFDLIRKMDIPSSRFELPHGFHSRYHWSRGSMSLYPLLGDRYYLSSMLAYTGQRGNSLKEILHYLEYAASSDETNPDGTVYLVETKGIRTEARQPWYSVTCKLLHQIDRKCEILSPGNRNLKNALPRNRDDIIGLSTGTRNFDWKSSGSRLLPGAFTDSFTSWAADFNHPSQTKLTEFLRQGASGSSGAVVEPYSFPEKFPLPLIHYYYASGCSMAESWYQSVASPYQALLVADPLSRPFVKFADMQLSSPNPQKPWSGTVHLNTIINPLGENEVERVELWVDGIPVSHTTSGKPLIWDTSSVDDGYHDIRIVAEEEGLIKTRSYIRHKILIYNHGARISASTNNHNPSFHDIISLQGTGEDNSIVEIFQGKRKLGETRIENNRWSIQIPAEPLGIGKVNLIALATTNAGNKVRSLPVLFDIQPPDEVHPTQEALTKHQPGLMAEIKFQDGSAEQRILKQVNGKFHSWFNNKPPLNNMRIHGELLIPESGFYQIAIRTKGNLTLSLGGKVFKRSLPTDKYSMIYIPISLGEGWHPIQIGPDPKGVSNLTVLISAGIAPTILGGEVVRNAGVKGNDIEPVLIK